MDQTPNQTKTSAAIAMLLRKRRRHASAKANPTRQKAIPKGDSSQMTTLVTLFADPAEVQYRATFQFSGVRDLDELPVLHEYGHDVGGLQCFFQRHQRKLVV